MSTSLGERIRTAREKADVSRERIAAECNVSRDTVERWERDESSPRLIDAPVLCRLLLVSPSWLVFGREQRA